MIGAFFKSIFMKISELVEQSGISEAKVREYATELGESIPENKSVITKVLAEKIIKESKTGVKEEKVTEIKKPEVVTQTAEVKEEKVEEEVVEEDDDRETFSIPPVISVKELAEVIDVSATQIIMQLVQNGFMVSVNENIDFDTVELMSEELGIKVVLEDIQKKRDEASDQTLAEVMAEDKESGSTRAPVISVMGHVDHGKTSLLDLIRKTNVVATESGSITQSIGAYQVHVKNRDITFIDTPGHEAFIAMRRRGVHATDIAILVVAANEGVKSQTKEAISHAQEANIPIIDANSDKVKTELTEIGLVPEEWGGEIMMVEVSTKENIGIDDLLERVLLLADVLELKANPNRDAVGTVIESNLDDKLGKISTILIHTGTLKVRDVVVIGGVFGKVRQLIDDTGKSLKEAGPAMPVMITGLSELPDVGDVLKVVETEKEARKTIEEYKRKFALDGNKEDFSIDMVSSKIKEEGVKGLRIILKGDNAGSIEAIEASLKKVRTENARIKVIRGRTGNISQSDILFAQAIDAKIIGFNVGYASNEVKQEVKERDVVVQTYNIIYKLVEELTEQMIESIEPEFDEVQLGVFKLKKIFLTKDSFMILGGKVSEGNIEKNSDVKVYRGEAMIVEGKILNIQKGTVEVDRVEQGSECGVQFKGKFKFKEGDMLHFSKMVERKFELQK